MWRGCYRGGWHPSYPPTYSLRFLPLAKASAKPKHEESPYRTSVHCKVFAPAAPRRARVSISVPFSGLPLSRPLLIVGLVVRYTANSLISRQLILRRKLSGMEHSSIHSPLGVNLRFPRVSPTGGQIIDVLLSSLPVLSCDSPLTCMA